MCRQIKTIYFLSRLHQTKPSAELKRSEPSENSTYRVVTTSRLKAQGHLVVHDNLKTFT